MSVSPRKKKNNQPGAIGLVMLLAILTVSVLVVGNRVFIIKKITVEGNRYCSTEEVVKSAGLSFGDSILAIDSVKIRDGINSNRYLEYVGMWRDLPDHLIITVKEHSPHATLTWMGMLYMLGENGMVLSETPQIDISLQVPVITGANVVAARAGSVINLGDAGQFDSIRTVLSELDRQGITIEVAELNVAVLDNLYLIMENGLQIVLGDAEDIGEKIALSRAVIARLEGTEEFRGAVLDVSSGEAADFRPLV